jgi:hypothetical protein
MTFTALDSKRKTMWSYGDEILYKENASISGRRGSRLPGRSRGGRFDD